MNVYKRLVRDWRFLSGLARTLGRIRSIGPSSPNLICNDLEAAVSRWRDRPAITFADQTLTYGQMDALANRYAHWALAQGFKRGDTVALFSLNRIDYVSIWYGLSKVGVVTALINNQLTGQALGHCLNISGASHVLVDPFAAPILEAARGELAGSVTAWRLGTGGTEPADLAHALSQMSDLPPTRAVRAGMTAADTALLMFTSGTTGLPKAAKVKHSRVQLYMRGFAGATGAGREDRIYIALPLYHATGGLCGVGAALLNGGSLLIRERFSTATFWSDLVAEQCTMFVYIGELCRYLVNSPVDPKEQSHKVRLAFGNGMVPDVWVQVETRFQVPRVLEFYGSTEGNVSMFNFDGQLGAIGRAPRWLGRTFNFTLAQFDVETEQPVRSSGGYCLEARVDQVGECIGRIESDNARADFSGYVDTTASEKKILRNVFAPGDAWFRTGDLMRRDGDGYFFFVDRVGDTFRWKGENVSTGEVAQRLQADPGVIEANVYGVKVPGADGRAGMAALVVDDRFDLSSFGQRVGRDLPAYAQPVFLRLISGLAVTGTFKHRKVDLVAQGFDPEAIGSPVYVRSPDASYHEMTPAELAEIRAGHKRL